MTSVTLPLMLHPQTRMDAVRGLTASVHRSRGVLSIAFALEGDIAHLRIPAPHAPQWIVGLWAHTCFEAFIALDGSPAYHEINLAPSGAWALFAFHAYRDLASLRDDLPPPEIVVRHSAERLDLNATVRLDRLSAAHATAPLRIALSAVVEDENGTLSCWALRHPPGQPDFHHADAFALNVPALGVDSGSDPR